MSPDAIPVPPSPAGKNFAGRDRALLYTRGMDLGPVQGLEFVLRSLSRAGEGAQPAVVMEELYGILRESGRSPAVTGASGAPLASAPPINRRSMAANDTARHSLAGLLFLLFRPLFAALRQRP